jgi:hypothetical protein
MRMLGGWPQVDRIAFDQPAGNEDQRTTPTSLATSACKPRRGRIGHKIAVLTRLEQTHSGLVARLISGRSNVIPFLANGGVAACRVDLGTTRLDDRATCLIAGNCIAGIADASLASNDDHYDGGGKCDGDDPKVSGAVAGKE